MPESHLLYLDHRFGGKARSKPQRRAAPYWKRHHKATVIEAVRVMADLSQVNRKAGRRTLRTDSKNLPILTRRPNLSSTYRIHQTVDASTIHIPVNDAAGLHSQPSPNNKARSPTQPTYRPPPYPTHRSAIGPRCAPAPAPLHARSSNAGILPEPISGTTRRFLPMKADPAPEPP